MFVVMATTAGSVEAGLISAFFGGLMIDLLAPRPLGMTAFILLVSVGVAALLGRVLDRVSYLVPVIAVFVTQPAERAPCSCSCTAPCASRSRSRTRSERSFPRPSTATAVAAVVGPIAVAIRHRAAERERVAW